MALIGVGRLLCLLNFMLLLLGLVALAVRIKELLLPLIAYLLLLAASVPLIAILL